MAGHRITHGQPFAQLLTLRKGDTVVVETREAVFTYVMDTSPADLTVKETAGWVLDPVPDHPGATPTEALHHPDDLPGPLPLTRPVGRLRSSPEHPEQVAADPFHGTARSTTPE